MWGDVKGVKERELRFLPLLLLALLPPIVKGKFVVHRWLAVSFFLMNHSLGSLLPLGYAVVKVCLVLGVLAVQKFKKWRWFGRLWALFFGWCAVSQGVSVGDYGIALVPPVLVCGVVLCAMWLFVSVDRPFKWNFSLREFFKVVLVLLAFFYPVGANGSVDFSLSNLLLGRGGAVFCSGTPLLLWLGGWLCGSEEDECRKALLLTAVVSLFFSLGTLVFVVLTDFKFFWFGLVHLPLLFLSSELLLFAFLKRCSRVRPAEEERGCG
jgi:hypothetical protein